MIHVKETITNKEIKKIAYQELKTISKGAFERIQCDIYVANEGHQCKIGDIENLESRPFCKMLISPGGYIREAI